MRRFGSSCVDLEDSCVDLEIHEVFVDPCLFWLLFMF